MVKLKILTAALVCAVLVAGPTGAASAKNSHGNGNGQLDLEKVLFFDREETRGPDKDWKGNDKSKGKPGRESQISLPWNGFSGGPVFKHGRILIPVNSVTRGLGAKVTWNLTGTVRIEKDGKYIEIDLDKNVAVVNGTEVDLAGVKNCNARIVFSPGLLKKLLEAAQKETLPAIIAEDLSMSAGQEKEFTVSASNPEKSRAYDRVLYRFSMANASLEDITSFQYKEGDTWKNVSMSQSGSSVVGYFGPSAGFPLPSNYSATTTFRLKMAGVGTYNVDIRLVDLNNNENTIARDSMTVTVNGTQASITAGDLTVFSGEEKEFTVSAANPLNSSAYNRVLYRFTMANASIGDIASFQYKDGNIWKNVPISQDGSSVVGYSGPSNGFALPVNYSATTTFRLKMARVGSYSVDIRLVDLDNNEYTLARDSMNLTVKAVPAVITAGDLTVAAGQDREFTVSAANPLNSMAYDRVLFRFSIANASLSDIWAFQYKEGDQWKNMPLSQSGSSVVGYFGTPGGFPLPVNYSASTTFRLRMTREDVYNVDIRLVDLNNSEFTIAQDNMTVTVN